VPSASRILARCDRLAAHSEQADGLTRVFLSPQQREVDALVLQWMREAGMVACLDAIGNCVGRYEGLEPGAPCLMLGSHLDTVRDAGRYDGMLGVVAAIECVDALHRRGRRFPFAIEVVGFGDEEGVRFGVTLIGSRAIAGSFDRNWLDQRDSSDTSLHDALRAFGLDPGAFGTVARRPEQVLAYAELHIEQGPVLESLGLPVGVVTAINGGNRFEVDLDGMAGHAGTVPMHLRRDALVAAAECVVAIEQVARSMPPVVATVGRIEAQPGAMNVIPGRVRFSLDIRAPGDELRLQAVAAARDAIDRIAQRRNVKASWRALWEAPTAPCATAMQEQIGAAIAAEGFDVHRLPSGAGHDGMAIVAIAPIGMLFVRCKGGISHSPAESVAPEDVDAGARALLRFIELFQPPVREAPR